MIKFNKKAVFSAFICVSVSLFSILNINTERVFAEDDKNIRIDTFSFPDKTFRQYISDEIDTDKNGVLTPYEYNSVQMIEVSGKMGVRGDIETLFGINFFPNLTYLDCSNNQIEYLDIGDNLELSFLACNNNYLKELNTSKNTKLKTISCDKNNLKQLDLSQNVILDYLSCDNNYLSVLDLSNNKVIEDLSCENNNLSELDLSNNMRLATLYCRNNKIVTLDLINHDLFTLCCSGNKLSNINLNNNTNLSFFVCRDNVQDVVIIDGKLNLYTIEGFNPQRAYDWSGATYNDDDDGTITVTSDTITYKYWCSNRHSATFTLNVIDNSEFDEYVYSVNHLFDNAGDTVVLSEDDLFKIESILGYDYSK